MKLGSLLIQSMLLQVVAITALSVIVNRMKINLAIFWNIKDNWIHHLSYEMDAE